MNRSFKIQQEVANIQQQIARTKMKDLERVSSLKRDTEQISQVSYHLKTTMMFPLFLMYGIQSKINKYLHYKMQHILKLNK